MSSDLLSIGSIAFDTIQTPSRFVEKALGGSANYFSIAASFFTKSKVVAVVGEDFPEQHLYYLKSRDVDIEGIKIEEGNTFCWEGEYRGSMEEAITHSTKLNVLEHFKPKLPSSYLNIPYIFLGNISPELQLSVLNQVDSPSLVAMDTMNFWINSSRKKLLEVLKKIDLLIINEEELKLLGEERDMVSAAKKIQEIGPKTLAIKQGNRGATSFHGEKTFSIPAVPVEKVVDPTGAGDTFAGGLMGYLAKNSLGLSEENLREAILYGNVMASFAIQDFSFYQLQEIGEAELQKSYEELKKQVNSK